MGGGGDKTVPSRWPLSIRSCATSLVAGRRPVFWQLPNGGIRPRWMVSFAIQNRGIKQWKPWWEAGSRGLWPIRPATGSANCLHLRKSGGAPFSRELWNCFSWAMSLPSKACCFCCKHWPGSTAIAGTSALSGLLMPIPLMLPKRNGM